MSRRTKPRKRSTPPLPAIYANATLAERRAISRDFVRLQELEAMALPIRERFEARKKELGQRVFPDDGGAAQLVAEFRPFAALLTRLPTPTRDLVCGNCKLPTTRCSCVDSTGKPLDWGAL